MTVPRRAVTGRGVVLPGDDVDTDRIVPARFAASPSFAGLGSHLLQDDRAAAQAGGSVHPLDEPVRRGASVIVVGHNFGCGSSREHAVHAVRGWGIEALVGLSISDIFRRNCTAVGLVAVTVPPEAHELLTAAVGADPALLVTIDLEAGVVVAGDLRTPMAIDRAHRADLLSGSWDVLGTLLEARPEVTALLGATPAFRFDPDLRSEDPVVPART